MGIVICLALLVALLQLQIQRDSFATGVASVVFLLGLWNTFWYGLRHLAEFWGMAAILSGVSMMLAALLIADDANLQPSLARFGRALQSGRGILKLLLLASFLLYTVTLIRLNLGLPIIE